MGKKTRQQPSRGPDRKAIERMWHTVSAAYQLHGRASGSFGLLCDLERVLHGEKPLEWNLVGRYREVMVLVESGALLEYE